MKWSCSGPLFDILVRNILLHVNVNENNLDGSVTGEVQASYNNIHKVYKYVFQFMYVSYMN